MFLEGLEYTKFSMKGGMNRFIHNDINDRKGRHSRESGNPGKDWIPGQARNDKLERTYVVMYRLKRTH